MTSVRLREVEAGDIGVFFEQQLDPEANHMAGFGAADPTDRPAFLARWRRILADPSILARTIVAPDAAGSEQVAGHILCFGSADEREVCYWLGREAWSRGIASQALLQFLGVARERPLLARAVRDNFASLRVLEKCGFQRFGTDSGYSSARGCDVDEVVVRLD